LGTTSIFKKGPDSWTLRYATAPAKLKELHEQGYKLVIFTNHSPIGRAVQEESRQKAIIQQTGRTGGFVELAQLPFQIFISAGRTQSQYGKIQKGDPHNLETDIYRKPETGMWDFMAKNCNGGVSINLAESFYVGGAAGRPKADGRKNADHSDYDIKFAKNIGIKFYADDEYFELSAKQPGPSLAGNKKRVSKKGQEGHEDHPEQVNQE